MITASARAAVAGAVVSAIGLGLLIIPYGAWVADKPLRILALPAVLVLLFCFVADKGKLFLLIILFRAAIDPFVFASTGIAFVGVGAALNALVLLIALVFVIEDHRPVMKSVLPLWAPLLVCVAIGIVKAPHFSDAVRLALVVLSYVAVFTIPFYLDSCRRDMRVAIYIVALSCVLPALYGVVELISGAKHQGRLLGPFPHPNIFGFYLVISIAASLYLAKTRTFAVSQSLRLGLLLYILVLVVLLLFTKTRAAWAACAAIFLVFGIFSERRYLVYLLATSALALLIPEVRERILDAFDPTSYWTSQYNSYEWRKDLWRSAWNWMSLGSMPFGYGLASFQHYSPQFLTSHLWPTNGVIEYGAHSLYVQWFFETGVVGVLAAAWLYFRLLRILAAGLKEDRLQTIIILALVCGYLVASYSDNMLSYLPVNWCFWFLLGSACAVLLRRNNQAGAAALESGKPTSARSVRSALYAHSGLSSERPEVLK